MNLTSQPLVSVLTPVYNGEKYLAECIESVLAQTYENWEYIIVNNCSTDNTAEIAQEYAEKDSRITIHNNKEFLSALQNHNHGLRLISAESKYCKVVHADDLLFPECLTQMVNVAEANPSVGIVGSYMLWGTEVIFDGLPFPSTIIPGREICRSSLLGGPMVFGSPTTHLIRSDLVRNRKAFYDESLTYEADRSSCYEVLQYSDFGFVHQVLTYTRVHDKQISATGIKLGVYNFTEIYRLVKYGPIYLGREEYEKSFKKSMRAYYRFLAQSLFRLRGKDLWDYHRKQLKDIGYPLSVARLINASLLEAIDMLFNPKETIRRIIRSTTRT